MEVVVLAMETEMQVESSLLGSGTDAAGKEEGGSRGRALHISTNEAAFSRLTFAHSLTL